MRLVSRFSSVHLLLCVKGEGYARPWEQGGRGKTKFGRFDIIFFTVQGLETCFSPVASRKPQTIIRL